MATTQAKREIVLMCYSIGDWHACFMVQGLSWYLFALYSPIGRIA